MFQQLQEVFKQEQRRLITYLFKLNQRSFENFALVEFLSAEIAFPSEIFFN